MKSTLKALVLLVAIFFLQSCVDLKNVNTFSETASKTLRSYGDIDYTFVGSYMRYSIPSGIYGKLDEKGNPLGLPNIAIDSAELALDLKADAAVNFFISSLNGYFEGLNKLSAKDLVNYNFDTLAGSIKGNSALKAKLGLGSDKTITSAAAIAKVFTDDIMGIYRERKLRDAMIKYNPDVKASIEGLRTILDKMLASNLVSDESLILGKYNVIMKDPAIDNATKISLIKEYKEERLDLEKKRVQMGKLSEALSKIETEHDETVKKLGSKKLTSKDVLALLQKYSGDLYSVYSQIKSITSK